MKTQLNELKRMQQLAGLLKESIEIPKGWSELDIDSDPEWNYTVLQWEDGMMNIKIMYI